MKFLLLIKSLFLEYKAIVIGIAVVFSVSLVGILISPSSLEKENPKTLGQKTENKQVTTTGEDAVSTLDEITPTGTKKNAQVTKTPTPTKKPATSQPTYVPTNTPAPTSVPTQTPSSSGEYVVDGAAFSSLYPTVSLKPGDKAVAFRIRSTGTKTFDIYDARVIGVTGITFTPMSGSIQPGETKDIEIHVDPNATPGSYGGFIGVKVDSGYPSLKLNITVTIQGGDANTKSIKVTEPAGGSVFKVGDKITIKWEANNISGPFEISITGDSGSPGTIASGIDNSNRSFTWDAIKPFDTSNATHFRFTVKGDGIISHSEQEIIINN